MNTKVIFAIKDMESAIEEGSQLLKKDEIVAFPTETVYGLGANAYSEKAVEKIFIAKGRPQDNPLIVHIAHKDQIDEVAKNISDTARLLIDRFAPGPVSFVLQKKDVIANNVTCNLNSVAVRIPSNEIAHKLLVKTGLPIAAPSANISGMPSPTLAKHVYEDMCGKIPLIIDGGQCKIGVESTVIDLRGEAVTILRPGSITKEDIEKVIKKVSMGEDIKEILSPGMKYRHYAPKAKVFVFYEEKKELEKCKSMYYSEEKAVIFSSDDFKSEFENMSTIFLGKPQDTAYSLYKALRQADELRFAAILFYFQNSMGAAVKNRISKAEKRGE